MDLLDWALLALVALAFGLALYKTIPAHWEAGK